MVVNVLSYTYIISTNKSDFMWMCTSKTGSWKHKYTFLGPSCNNNVAYHSQCQVVWRDRWLLVAVLGLHLSDGYTPSQPHWHPHSNSAHPSRRQSVAVQQLQDTKNKIFVRTESDSFTTLVVIGCCCYHCCCCVVVLLLLLLLSLWGCSKHYYSLLAMYSVLPNLGGAHACKSPLSGCVLHKKSWPTPETIHYETMQRVTTLHNTVHTHLHYQQ